MRNWAGDWCSVLAACGGRARPGAPWRSRAGGPAARPARAAVVRASWPAGPSCRTRPGRTPRRGPGRGGDDGGDGRAARCHPPVADLGPGHRDVRPRPDRGGRGPGQSTSATRTRSGSAAATRTPTGCCASTSPRAPTLPCTAGSTWKKWPPSSTPGPARPWGGRPPRRRWMSSWPAPQPERSWWRPTPPLIAGGCRAWYGAAPPASRLLRIAARRPCGPAWTPETSAAPGRQETRARPRACPRPAHGTRHGGPPHMVTTERVIYRQCCDDPLSPPTLTVHEVSSQVH